MPIMAYDTEDSSRNADFLWTSPYGREGSGAFGARVLSFVCFAPNDGFGPQSGLVQRGVLYTAAWGSENRTTALTGEEIHSPFGGWRHHLSAPLGSVSLDSQSPTAPYESSSLATASGGFMDA